MRRLILWVGTAAIVAALVGVQPPVVQALPPPPSTFWGTVWVDGGLASAGTLVAAWSGGVKWVETVVVPYEDQMYYSLDVPGDDPETPDIKEGPEPGDTIIFTVGVSQAVETATWENSAPHQLDLHAAVPACTYHLPIVGRLWRQPSGPLDVGPAHNQGSEG